VSLFKDLLNNLVISRRQDYQKNAHDGLIVGLHTKQKYANVRSMLNNRGLTVHVSQ